VPSSESSCGDHVDIGTNCWWGVNKYVDGKRKCNNFVKIRFPKMAI
jgi:hypothetical protein